VSLLLELGSNCQNVISMNSLMKPATIFTSKASRRQTASDISVGTHAGKILASCSARVACFALVTGLALAVCGCRKETKTTAPTPADLKPLNPNDSLEVQEQKRVAQLRAFHAGVDIPPPSIKLRGGELATPEVLEAYNQELTRVRFKVGESPESLQALVQKWIQRRRLLPPLPTAPPGKRIVYDPLRVIIRLEPP
jgi:hypothetical protein